jgi:peptide/nickel transport system ATP-binding protein
MSMVFQEPMTALNPVMKCGIQVIERIEVMKGQLSSAQPQDGLSPERFELKQLLEEVELTDLDRIINSYPHQLSGGQRQRLMLAMALVGEPALLIADEPTTALDVRVQASILKLIERLVRSRGLSLLLISHDLGLVERMADDVLVLRKGRTMEYGKTRDVLKQPASAYTRALLDSRLNPSKKGKWLTFLSEDGTEATPQFMAGEVHQRAESSLMLEIKGLTVRYPLPRKLLGSQKYRMALESIDLSIQTGQTLGLVGESGSGKSTLSRVLVGLTPVIGGEIRLNGRPFHPREMNQLKRARLVQMIFQDPYSSLNPAQKIGELLQEVVRVHRLRPVNAIKDRVAELLRSVGLEEEYAHRFPGQLSGGQRQRIVIARALAAEPQLLVCDESVSALDVSVQAQVLNLLKSLQESLNLTYLFISHDLSVVYHMSDEIAVLHHGRIVEQKKATELYAHPEHPYTKELLASTFTHYFIQTV